MYNAQETIDIDKTRQELKKRYDLLKNEIEWHNYYSLSQINIFDAIKQYNKDLQKHLRKEKRFTIITSENIDNNESLWKMKELNSYNKIKKRVTEIYITHFNIGC